MYESAEYQRSKCYITVTSKIGAHPINHFEFFKVFKLIKCTLDSNSVIRKEKITFLRQNVSEINSKMRFNLEYFKCNSTL